MTGHKYFIDSSAALASNCQYLISEDMQDGQKIDTLIIKNIL
jgi:predicted nucleic acid-binding protein